MTYSANLSEQQSQFLDAMATQFNFGSNTLTVFLARFDKAKRNQDNFSLAITISWNRELEDKRQKFQDELRKICQVLEDNGCPIEKPKKPKKGRPPKGKSPWEQAFKWLWETKFIEWQQRQEKLVEPITIDALVNQVREKVSADIQKRCGWMHVLDMTHPIGINEIYTNVNILKKITAHRRLKLAQLLKNYNPEDFERFGLNQVVEKRVPGLTAVEQYFKLMILGKPGAGKTTFLKRIAIQCNSGQFLADHVPIFIALKDFAETPQQPSLWQYINDQLATNDISDQEITKTLLLQGRVIMLLDGLDEVRQADNNRVFREIRNFSTQYDANHFVITCRIASKEYTFEQFIEVEVADFEDEQITEFATKWFQTKDPKEAQEFIQKLQVNQRIKALATNPLLLTLLCLIFGETLNFPSKRSDLYQEGVNLLLKKWDAKRYIEREQVYKKLSYERKECLLSTIALKTFESGNYFFEEELAKEYIRDYIQNIPDAQTDPEALLLDSEAVLKSIEAQHGLLIERARGIYSFPHLTFHEFFIARNIALSRNSQQMLQQLVSHITDERWREVFLLTVGIFNNADDLLQLMKKRIDEILATDKTLQEFLTWLDLKSSTVEVFYELFAIRGYYFTLARDLVRDRYVDPALTPFPIYRGRRSDFDPENILYLDHALNSIIELALEVERGQTSDHKDNALVLAIVRALNINSGLNLGPELQCSLQELKQQLLNITQGNLKQFKQWWQTNGQAWTEQLRTVIIQHRNIGHNWHFNNDQWQLLKNYYDANMLLFDCLDSECNVSPSVRQEIEDTLMLPINRN